MKIHRIDHVSVIVNDLPPAKAFFLALGLEVLWETWARRDYFRVGGANQINIEGTLFSKRGRKMVYKMNSSQTLDQTVKDPSSYSPKSRICIFDWIMTGYC